MLDSSSGAHKSSLGGTQTCCKVILGPSNPVHENWYDIYVKDKKWKVEAEGTGLKTYIDSIRRQNAFSKNSESYQIIGSGEPVEVKLRNLIDLYHRQPYSIQVRDPVGAHSLHVCTLHGEFELAWAWICEMKNILPPQHWYEWVTAEYRPEFPGVPDTPYQGETILHIAIGSYCYSVELPSRPLTNASFACAQSIATATSSPSFCFRKHFLRRKTKVSSVLGQKMARRRKTEMPTSF